MNEEKEEEEVREKEEEEKEEGAKGREEERTTRESVLNEIEREMASVAAKVDKERIKELVTTEINLEKQLENVQRQLLSLKQLPSEIENHLRIVSEQLQKIMELSGVQNGATVNATAEEEEEEEEERRGGGKKIRYYFRIGISNRYLSLSRPGLYSRHIFKFHAFQRG